MTLCLTFDDGLKTHAEIAAPALKARGWSGAFCVPTGLMDPMTCKLTSSQSEDMCLVGHEDNLMDWDDVRRMMADGKRDEIERQIAWSREAFVP